MAFVASSMAAVSVGGVLWVLLQPPRSISARIEPYRSAGRAGPGWALTSGIRRRTLGRVILSSIAERVGSAVDGLSRPALDLRLRQAGLFQEAVDPAGSYRLRQLLDIAVAGGGAVFFALLLGMSPGQTSGMGVLGLVVGLTRQRGRVTSAIDERRRRMVIEVYTIDQVLALRVRTGGGVIGAVDSIVRTAGGEVVAELAEALRLHRAGLSARESFTRIAETTPEPACSRTYSFLALAEERGSDLGEALLSLADDVREARREAIRRTATKRRAAMLVPTVAVLAPVMLLFIGAPLPALILGFT